MNNSNAKILDISIIKSNNSSNNAQINPIENGFNFGFDFLKKNNGVVVQVIHTGQDDDIKFTGELIDGNLKCENLSSVSFLKPLTKTPSPKATKIMDTIFLICISIAFLAIAILSCIVISSTSFSVSTIFCLLFLLYALLFYYLLYKYYFTVPRSLSSYLSLDKQVINLYRNFNRHIDLQNRK